ncbi:MAG: hypothetical protein Q9201_001651 [Fulgogasparrea decipioides]
MAASRQELSNDNIDVQDPFKDWTRSNLEDEAKECIRESRLHTFKDYIINGAYLAQDPEARLAFEGPDHHSTRPRDLENVSILKGFRQQPRRLYAHVFCCALGALIQGMDESAVNGAQLYYVKEFPYTNRSAIKGLVNGAPYACCVLSCFSECVPTQIRGALVMQWQTFTAIGIMLGLIFDFAFMKIGKNNWRFMIGSPMVAPFILFFLLWSQPESPRWHLQQAFKRLERAGNSHSEKSKVRFEEKARRHFEKAYLSLYTLRSNHLETGRDFFVLWYLLKDEIQRTGASSGRRRMVDLWRIPRCRHAFVAGLILMFLQQFCGVNVLAYYSSTVYQSASASDKFALGVSYAESPSTALI